MASFAAKGIAALRPLAMQTGKRVLEQMPKTIGGKAALAGGGMVGAGTAGELMGRRSATRSAYPQGMGKWGSFAFGFFDELEKIQKAAGIMGKATFMMNPAVWAGGKLLGKAFKTAVKHSPIGVAGRAAGAMAGQQPGILPTLGRGVRKGTEFAGSLMDPIF